MAIVRQADGSSERLSARRLRSSRARDTGTRSLSLAMHAAARARVRRPDSARRFRFSPAVHLPRVCRRGCRAITKGRPTWRARAGGSIVKRCPPQCCPRRSRRVRARMARPRWHGSARDGSRSTSLPRDGDIVRVWLPAAAAGTRIDRGTGPAMTCASGNLVRVDHRALILLLALASLVRLVSSSRAGSCTGLTNAFTRRSWTSSTSIRRAGSRRQGAVCTQDHLGFALISAIPPAIAGLLGHALSRSGNG